MLRSRSSRMAREHCSSLHPEDCGQAALLRKRSGVHVRGVTMLDDDDGRAQRVSGHALHN